MKTAILAILQQMTRKVVIEKQMSPQQAPTFMQALQRTASSFWADAIMKNSHGLVMHEDTIPIIHKYTLRLVFEAMRTEVKEIVAANENAKRVVVSSTNRFLLAGNGFRGSE